LRLGAHLTITKGPAYLEKLVRSINADCFAFFSRNPQGGSARTIPEKEAAEWRKLKSEKQIYPLVGHMPYTVNIGAPKEETYEFATRILTEDLRRCDAFGTDYLVLHPGSHVGSGPDATIERIVRAIDAAFKDFSGQTMLLLETMAGHGTEVGSIAEIGRIFRLLGNPPFLGVCFDSCHLFAAGYDVRTKEGIDRAIDELDCEMGPDCIKAIHLNDSKFGLGSHKDRHARVGTGEIGNDGLRTIITHPVLSKLAFIVETPVDDYEQYGEEISALRALL